MGIQSSRCAYIAPSLYQLTILILNVGLVYFSQLIRRRQPSFDTQIELVVNLILKKNTELLLTLALVVRVNAQYLFKLLISSSGSQYSGSYKSSSCGVANLN